MIGGRRTTRAPNDSSVGPDESARQAQEVERLRQENERLRQENAEHKKRIADLERQLASFRQLGVRWVVFTGGEPQLNDQLSCLALMLRAEGIRVTMLTAGLLLEPHAESI